MPIALAAALAASACLARHPRLDRAADAAPVEAAVPFDGGSTDPGRDAGTPDAAVARDASGDWERVEIWLASTEGLLIGATLRGEPLVEATAPAEEGLRPSAHGLDVDGNGRVHVLIGRFGDHLITFDPRDGSWGPWRGASGLGNGSPPEHGGVAVMGPAVYVSDQHLATRWSSGVVRYELEGDGPGERVGPEDWFNTWDVAAGDDGRLWVLGDYGVYTGLTPCPEEPDSTDGCRTTRFTFTDFEAMFPTSVEHSNGIEEDVSFDPIVGQVSHFTDANGAEATTVRDGLGRIVEQHRMGGDSVYAAWTQGGVHPELRVRTGSGGDRRILYDALGRTHEVWIRRALDGDWFRTRLRYGLESGQRETETLPARVPGTAGERAWRYLDATGLGAEEVATPGLGRLLEHRDGAGAVTAYRYSGRDLEWDDPDGNTHREHVDGSGRVVTRAEPAVDGVSATVAYAYGPFGRLSSVADAAGNTTALEHDALGNVTRWVDPDRGERLFDYNAFGELWRERRVGDPLVTIHQYDELGRPVRRTDFQGASSEVTRWVYDGGPGAAFSLVDAYSPDGAHEHFEYDAVGLRSRVILRVPGQEPVETSVRERDASGRPTRVLMPAGPGGETVETIYEFGRYGHLEALRFGVGCAPVRDPAGTFFDCDLDQEVWRVTGVDDAGRPAEIHHGNGLSSLSEFDPMTGRLERLQTITPLEERIQDFAIAYTAAGDIRARSTLAWDTGGYRTEELEHDERHRLRWARVRSGGLEDPPAPWESELELRYDAIDNLTYRSDVGAFGYDPTGRPHAVRSAGPGLPDGSIEYDPRGNQIRSGTQRRRFDARDRIEVLTDRAIGRLRYAYTASGERALSRHEGRDGRSRETLWFGSTYERHREIGMEAFRETHVYRAYAGTTAVAELRWEAGDEPVILFLHHDPQGSTTTVTALSGAIVDRRGYDVVGRYRDPDWGPISPGPWEHPGYTGHRTGAEADLGLIYMGTRHYDARSSHMLSPDPRLLPQLAADLNPYSYAWNNPLRFADPSGAQETCNPPTCIPDTGPELGVTVILDLRNQPGRTIERHGQTYISVPVYDGTGARRDYSAFRPVTPAELELITSALLEVGLTVGEVLEESSVSELTTYMGQTGQENWDQWIDENALPTRQMREAVAGMLPMAMAALSAIPGAAEASDVAILADPDSDNVDFVAAYISLVVSLATLGTTPNYGAMRLGVRASDNLLELSRASQRSAIYDPFRASDGTRVRGTNAPGQLTRRGSWRRGTVDRAWESAEPGPSGGRLCPTCGNEVTVPPRSGQPRDWDINHDPPWTRREFPDDVTRRDVLDEYQEGTGLECPGCNRSAGNRR